MKKIFCVAIAMSLSFFSTGCTDYRPVRIGDLGKLNHHGSSKKVTVSTPSGKSITVNLGDDVHITLSDGRKLKLKAPYDFVLNPDGMSVTVSAKNLPSTKLYRWDIRSVTSLHGRSNSILKFIAIIPLLLFIPTIFHVDFIAHAIR